MAGFKDNWFAARAATGGLVGRLVTGLKGTVMEGFGG